MMRANTSPAPLIAPTRNALTILDLDRTVTRHGTYTPFLLYAAKRHAPWRLILVPAVILCMIIYRCGGMRRKTLKQAMHRILLGDRMPQTSIDAIADGFAQRVVRSNLNTGVLDLIARERKEGRTIILATAAHRFYAHSIARRLGIDSVVATESVWEGDILRSAISGENCYGRDKALALTAFLEAHGLNRTGSDIRCFSDDVSDLPLFEFSDEPVGFKPSPRLRRLCKLRGWPVHQVV